LRYWSASAPSSSLRVEREPGFDAGLLDALGDGFDQFGGARMQRAGFAMQEEGQGHAPVALPRDAPVGARTHHRFEARATPAREELRFVDGAFGAPAQRRLFFVRAASADDGGRLVDGGPCR
jgi:hypothetical protein